MREKSTIYPILLVLKYFLRDNIWYIHSVNVVEQEYKRKNMCCGAYSWDTKGQRSPSPLKFAEIAHNIALYILKKWLSKEDLWHTCRSQLHL